MEQLVFYIIIFNFILILFLKNTKFKLLIIALQIFNIINLIYPLININLQLPLIEKVFKLLLIILLLIIGFYFKEKEIKKVLLISLGIYLFLRIAEILNLYISKTYIPENTLLVFLTVYLIKRFKYLFKIFPIIMFFMVFNLVGIKNSFANTFDYDNLINDLNFKREEIKVEKEYVSEYKFNEKLVLKNNTIYICDELIENKDFSCDKDSLIIKNNSKNTNPLLLEKNGDFYIPKFNLYYSPNYKEVIKQLKLKKIGNNQKFTDNEVFKTEDIVILNILFWLYMVTKTKVWENIQNFKKHYSTKKIIILTILFLIISLVYYYATNYYKFYKNSLDVISNLSSLNYEKYELRNLDYINKLNKNESYVVNFNQQSLQWLLKNQSILETLKSSNPSNTIFIPEAKEDIENIELNLNIKCENADNYLNTFKKFNLNIFYYYDSMLRYEYPIYLKKELFSQNPCYLNYKIDNLLIKNVKIYGGTPKIISFSNQENYKIKDIKLLSTDNQIINFYYLNNSNLVQTDILKILDANFTYSAEVNKNSNSFLNSSLPYLFNFAKLNFFK